MRKYSRSVRIATWNINSVNRRLERVTDWLEQTQTDVLCLQETKCSAADFPSMIFEGAGYTSVAAGDGAWNGVAILSRVGLDDVIDTLPNAPEWEGSIEPRAIAATCGGIRIWSLYVPNGRTLEHEHYRYKLEWLDQLTAAARNELATYPNLALLGDFNIAPTDDDVWDLEVFTDSTHVTAAERQRLADLQQLGLREVEARPLKYDRAYTFWDYRQLAFPKNHGMRIDLAYVSQPIADSVSDAYVDRETRKGKGSSDHAPVVVDIDQG